MAASDFLSGGSSVVALKKVDALVIAIIMLYNAERLANKDSSGAATNFVSYTLAAAAQRSFTATLNLPARQVRATDGTLTFKARNFVADYVTFEPGTEDLQNTASLPEAVVEIAEQINYWEKQIQSNLVINQANQVTVTPNKDTGTIAVAVSLPIEQVVDALGVIGTEAFDYLFVVSE
jgi:hypothetical protein